MVRSTGRESRERNLKFRFARDKHETALRYEAHKGIHESLREF